MKNFEFNCLSFHLISYNATISAHYHQKAPASQKAALALFSLTKQSLKVRRALLTLNFNLIELSHSNILLVFFSCRHRPTWTCLLKLGTWKKLYLRRRQMTGWMVERMAGLWDRLSKYFLADSCRVDLIVVVVSAVAVVGVVAPERNHYVNFVGMMTRNDLVAGSLKNFGFLKERKKKKRKTLMMHVMRQSAYNCVNYVQEWKNGTKEWSCACEKSHFQCSTMKWCKNCLFAKRFNCESIKTTQRNSIAKNKQRNEPLVIACVYMAIFTLLQFEFHSREIVEMEISSCAWWCLWLK